MFLDYPSVEVIQYRMKFDKFYQHTAGGIWENSGRILYLR